MKDELESQLSAMFDGELPAAECELLARRIDRDEKLRARWARYVLIGASMRREPVATASAGFAARVGSALAAQDQAAQDQPAARVSSWVWQSALAAGLVVAVAGLSIALLQTTALNGVGVGAGVNLVVERDRAASPVSPASNRVPAVLAGSTAPWSYVTPVGGDRLPSPPLRSELADYIVAHSEYSTPLMRSDLLSALVSGEQGFDDPSIADGAVSPAISKGSASGTGRTDAPIAASPARR